MQKPLIVVTGKNGQVGWELMQLAAANEKKFDFLFTGREELDLLQIETIPDFFKKYKPAYFINCAAYTAVDKAETEREQATLINIVAVAVIAAECRTHNCVFISLSTDYVFAGNGKKPYKPGEIRSPVNYYGNTKAQGEERAQEANPQTIIVRTSWVYSTHGTNFVKTMLRLMKEKPEIKVVDDQVGCPTYAADLAEALLGIAASFEKGNKHSGIYHYSNTGVISWFDFATAIRNEAGLTCHVIGIPTAAYPTPAKRPAYSVMDTSDITNDFGIGLKEWRQSLRKCLQKLTTG